MTPNQHDLSNELLAGHPAKALTWLNEWLARGEQIHLESEINWLGLVEVAAWRVDRFHERRSLLDSFLWGVVAIKVFDELAKNSDRGFISFSERAMCVRSNLIQMFGNHPGDDICDSTLISDWFQKQLPFSIEEAERQATTWHSKNVSRSFELKLLVEQLEIIESLSAAKLLEPNPTVACWLDFYRRLKRSKSNNKVGD